MTMTVDLCNSSPFSQCLSFNERRQAINYLRSWIQLKNTNNAFLNIVSFHDYQDISFQKIFLTLRNDRQWHWHISENCDYGQRRLTQAL
jgi:hypothetical protein